MQKINLKMITLAISVLGIFFALFIPPFQKPDENRHYLQASAVSRGEFRCLVDNGRSYLKLPESVVSFPKLLKVDELAHTYSVKFTPSMFGLYPYPKSDAKVKDFSWCSYSSIGYLPSSAGLLIGRLSGSRMIEFYLGRLVPLMLFVASAAYALSISSPSSRIWITIFSFIPMTLHQVTSIGYDNLQLILLPIIFAYFAQIFEKDVEKVDDKISFLLFHILLLIFILAKPAYFPLLLLSFFYKKTIRSVIFILLSVAIIYPTMKPSFYPGTPTGVSISLQQHLVLTDPLHFISSSINTLIRDGQSIYEGLIGNFGWLDYKLNYFFYLILPVILVYFLSKPRYAYKANPPKLIVLFSIVVVTMASIFASLYIIWTPVGTSYVSGIQGRYFLVLLPFLFLILSGYTYILRNNRLIRNISVVAVGFLLVLNLVISTYLRYYDYSKAGVNDLLSEEGLSDHLLIDKESAITIDLPAGAKKLTGFYFYRTDDISENAFYSYSLLSSDCKTVYKKGYLEGIWSIENKGLVKVLFTPFWVTEDKVCLRLTPLDDSSKDLTIKGGRNRFILPLYLVTSLR